MNIRAAVLEQFGQPLNVTEVDLADPRPGEVLVRVEACGVCHTDMYTASGADPSGYAPTVLGHEGAGVVERCGAESARSRRPLNDYRQEGAGDDVAEAFKRVGGEEEPQHAARGSRNARSVRGRREGRDERRRR